MANRHNYRAWDSKNKRWACGLNSDHKHFALIGEVTMFDLLNQYRLEEYDDLILVQSTGLADRNGVEIFEGDIVEAGDFNKWFLSVIVWCERDGRWGAQQGNNTVFYSKFITWSLGCDRWLVKGNIYENPNMIEVLVK